MKHINNVIWAIRAMPGPAEGELIIALHLKSNNEFWGHFSPLEAIDLVRDNPRLEFQAAEKWQIN